MRAEIPEEVKTYSQKSTGKLFYFIVLDREGSEMQVTCFNKAADKFFEMVEENEVYEIKGFLPPTVSNTLSSTFTCYFKDFFL